MLRSCKQTGLKKTLRWKKCFTDEYNILTQVKRFNSRKDHFLFMFLYMLKKPFIYRSLLLGKRKAIEFVSYT